jgi:outer membrane protein OmpA-like peptidoglycan-associated protein
MPLPAPAAKPAPRILKPAAKPKQEAMPRQTAKTAPPAAPATVTAPPAEDMMQDESALSAHEEDVTPPKEEPEKETKAPAAVPAKEDLSLDFSGTDCDITPEIAQKLAGVAAQMKENEELRLQVRAYATGEEGNRSSARRISLSRALSVRAWLMDNGIKPSRIDVRALGAETDTGQLDRADLVFVR